MYCEQNYTVAEIAYLLHYVILSSDYLSILPHNNYHLPHVSFFAAYWGCRTPDYTVNVYSPLKAALVCPIAVRPSEEFTCSAEFIEGSGIQSIQWKLDGAPNGAAITNVGGEPYLVSVYVGVGGGGVVVWISGVARGPWRVIVEINLYYLLLFLDIFLYEFLLLF